MYLLYIIQKVYVLQRTCDAGYFQHKIIIFCSVWCISMAPAAIQWPQTAWKRITITPPHRLIVRLNFWALKGS